jgi:hypothetical protein
MQIQPRAVLFDLDDTLAESFQAPLPPMIDKLDRLLERLPVAIISAASFDRIERTVVQRLSSSEHFEQLTLFPNSSAECYIWQDGWALAYDFELTYEERVRIERAIVESVEETGVQEGQIKYEPRILDRRVQIAYAAIGLEASEADKASWDPDQAKRRRLKEAVERRIPGFEVLIGGKTSIDITREGIDKSYGVRWLAERLACEPRDMLYIADALYEGGNDAVVIPTGIVTKRVTGPAETEVLIDELLASVSG